MKKIICLVMVIMMAVGAVPAMATSTTNTGAMTIDKGTEINIPIGGFEDLRASVNGEYIPYLLVEWTSDNEEVAVIVDDFGRVSAIAEGTATLTAVYEENGRKYVATCTVVVEHKYNAEHICEYCGEPYNSGKKIEGNKYSYDTHIFCDLTTGCKICGEKCEYKTNLYDLSRWEDYTPGDVGVSPRPTSLYFSIQNGELIELHHESDYTLSCSYYVAHDEGWHEEHKASRKDKYTTQLIREKQVTPCQSVYPIWSEAGFSYPYFPSGRIKAFIKALNYSIRYCDEEEK